MNLLQDKLQETLKDGQIRYGKVIDGGFINNAALYYGDTKPYFVKYNTRPETLSLFKCEKESLSCIKNTGIIRVPEVYQVIDLSNTEPGAAMVEEYFEDLQPIADESEWFVLGEKIARLHKYNIDMIKKWKSRQSSVHENQKNPPVEEFGFQLPSFIGHFTPGVVWTKTWTEYFTRHILDSQFRYVEEEFHDRELQELWSQLQLVINKFFKDVEIYPSLLHGDFCSSNFGINDCDIVTFDPQCRYGHNEFEFAAQLVERDFKDSFFTGYFNIFPKSDGYEKRQLLYNMFGNLIYFTHGCGDNYRLKACTDLKQLILMAKNE